MSWDWLNLKYFNDNYANAVQALTPIFVVVFWWVISNIIKSKNRDYIRPIFWTLGKKYKILAVHRYEKSNIDPSWYKHLGQNSRPDQRKNLIKINSFLKLRFEVIPNDKRDILEVIISRDWLEKYKIIQFNK